MLMNQGTGPFPLCLTRLRSPARSCPSRRFFASHVESEAETRQLGAYAAFLPAEAPKADEDFRAGIKRSRAPIRGKLGGWPDNLLFALCCLRTTFVKASTEII